MRAEQVNGGDSDEDDEAGEADTSSDEDDYYEGVYAIGGGRPGVPV